MPIIEVDHVTKEFKLGQLTSLKQSVVNALHRLTGHPTDHRHPFKALKDVSFSVEAGEVLGIIGHNGAGKSTLLKLLSNISQPTSGSIAVRGKVAPLIEVGAGLIGDLTGRENIYLNGAILGLPKSEIRRKFDEIVAFAELEQFIDTPIKRYSSGMQVRLGFAVATSVESDILIVDEVLAVGDLAFQRKCFDRIEDLIRRHGRTVLLVSHNIRQVERLCSRVMLLSRGSVVLNGNATDVCNAYYESSDKQIQEAQSRSTAARTESSGDIELESIKIIDNQGQATTTAEYLQAIEFQIKYRVINTLHKPVFGFGIHTTDFLYLATNQSIGHLTPGTLTPGSYTLRYKIHKFPFLPATYSVRLGVALENSFQPIFYIENATSITVTSLHMNRAICSDRHEGFVALDGRWELTSQDSVRILETSESPNV